MHSADAARKIAAHIATELGERFGAQSVFLFGSLARRDYGSPEKDHFKKLSDAIRSAGESRPLLCGARAAAAHTRCVNGMQESCPEIRPFPPEYIDYRGSQCVVRGLTEALLDCYKRGILPSEAALPWAAAGASVDVAHYDFFPSGMEPPGKGT